MTMLPRLEVLSDEAVLTLEDGHTALLRTPDAARKLGDLCRAAEQRLVEQHRALAREHDDDLDRLAASAMNADHREHDRFGPGLQHNAPPIKHAVVRRACGCATSEHCPECRGGAA